MPNTTTPEGVSVTAQNIAEDEAGKLAKAAQKHAEAPIKGFEDLPPDHPMARRAAMMGEIEAINEKIDGSKDGDDAVAAVIAKAADPDHVPIESFTDKPGTQAAPAPKAEPKLDATSQIAAQTTDPIVIDSADLAKYQVRTKVDGVEELVPATKVLGQYQKGAAADVRLAQATKLQKEAQAALNAALAAPAPATTAQAVTQGANAASATEKFKEASDALYSGDADRAAALFSEAVAAATGGQANGRGDATLSSDELVNQTATAVTQRLSQQGALKQLFEDYPDIKSKKAFAIIADEYTAAFIENGDDVATAIHKAGEAIGEEYGLGKWGAKAAPVNPGRQVKNGGPTTRAEKLSAKEELDNIQSSNARSVGTEAQEPSVLETLEAMRKARPGQALTQ